MPKPINVPEVSLVPDHEDAIVEMCQQHGKTHFAVFRKGAISIEKSYPKSAHATYVPYRATNNILRNRVVLFAERAVDYDSEANLFDEICWYIHRYVDLAPEHERVAAAFVMLSWVYDRFNDLPYLRVRGDFGSGKTRFLLIVGAICYKPTFASGASTVSPLFHLLDSFKGTLVLDEADFRWSDEKSEIIKLLNNGNVRGMPVLRTRISNEREYNPKAFSVFGPKIVATRGHYDDKGLESRFITFEMGIRPMRGDVPISLPAIQEQEALALRNKLLMFRFKNLHRISTKPHFFASSVGPRFKQIFVPLMSVIDDLELHAELEALAHEYTRQLDVDRGLDAEAQMLIAIKATDEGTCGIAVKDVAMTFRRKFAEDYDDRITPRWVGAFIRRKLNLKTQKSNGNYVVPLEELPQLATLYEKYGIEKIEQPTNPNELPTIQA